MQDMKLRKLLLCVCLIIYSTFIVSIRGIMTFTKLRFDKSELIKITDKYKQILFCMNLTNVSIQITLSLEGVLAIFFSTFEWTLIGVNLKNVSIQITLSLEGGLAIFCGTIIITLIGVNLTNVSIQSRLRLAGVIAIFFSTFEWTLIGVNLTNVIIQMLLSLAGELAIFCRTIIITLIGVNMTNVRIQMLLCLARVLAIRTLEWTFPEMIDFNMFRKSVFCQKNFFASFSSTSNRFVHPGNLLAMLFDFMHSDIRQIPKRTSATSFTTSERFALFVVDALLMRFQIIRTLELFAADIALETETFMFHLDVLFQIGRTTTPFSTGRACF